MRTPGFAAEAVIGPPASHHRASTQYSSAFEGVRPAQSEVFCGVCAMGGFGCGKKCEPCFLGLFDCCESVCTETMQ